MNIARDSEHADLLPRRGSSAGLPGAAPLARAGTTTRGQSFLLHVCRVFNAITALCALLCALALGMAFYVRGEAAAKDAYFVSGQALRLFGISSSLLIVLVETEWQRFLALAPLLEAWLGRGVLQVYQAVLTYREAYPVGETDFHKSLQLYRSAASLSLLVCGSVYLLGAVTCIGAIKHAKQRQEAAVVRAEAELERMDRRKRELERQLGRPAAQQMGGGAARV